jgi:tRNA-(ms[2]io[6]A)-hydroxylase
MLGLDAPTDERWIESALADLDALLIDHAHCEMKAASNAMSLAVRHGDRPELVTALVSLAEEELAHFRRVHEMIVARGLSLGTPPVDPYAAKLRKALKRTPEIPVLVDRLLVGALIEARSCERFSILASRAPEDLRAFYAELFVAEAGHYRTFLDLAIAEGARDGVDAQTIRGRLKSLAAAEGVIVRGLEGEASRSSVHG